MPNELRCGESRGEEGRGEGFSTIDAQEVPSKEISQNPPAFFDSFRLAMELV